VSHYNGHTTQHTLQFSRNPLENSPFGTSQLRFDYLQQRSVPLQLTDHLMVGSSIAQSQQTKRMVAQLPRWELLQVNWFTPFALTAFEYEPSIYREQGSQYTDQSSLHVSIDFRHRHSHCSKGTPPLNRKDSPSITKALAGVTTKLRKNDFSLGEVVGLYKRSSQYSTFAWLTSLRSEHC
jgi:hypothetical protein